jgi:hypothetical protein
METRSWIIEPRFAQLKQHDGFGAGRSAHPMVAPVCDLEPAHPLPTLKTQVHGGLAWATIALEQVQTQIRALGCRMSSAELTFFCCAA